MSPKKWNVYDDVFCTQYMNKCMLRCKLQYTFFQLLFNYLIISFNIIKLISTLFKNSKKCAALCQQSICWDQQSNNWFQQMTNVTSNINNYQNCSSFSQLKSAKHQILFSNVYVYQQCTTLIKSSAKFFNNFVWRKNITSYSLLVILVTMVQFFVYACLPERLCYKRRCQFPLYVPR